MVIIVTFKISHFSDFQSDFNIEFRPNPEKVILLTDRKLAFT